MRRGEVYWAELVPRSGSEQSGRRPVVLVSHNGFNQTPSWRSVIVVPLSTSEAQAKRAITVVEIPGGAFGLPKKCYALCHQVTTLDRAKLTRLVGVLAPDLIALLEDGLKAALDLD